MPEARKISKKIETFGAVSVFLIIKQGRAKPGHLGTLALITGKTSAPHYSNVTNS
jgi:hypothetical protein